MEVHGVAPFPSPMMPNVLPLTSTPTRRPRSHLPALRLAHPSVIFLATASIKAIVCSAAARTLPDGLFTTMTPCFVAASTSGFQVSFESIVWKTLVALLVPLTGIHYRMAVSLPYSMDMTTTRINLDRSSLILLFQ